MQMMPNEFMYMTADVSVHKTRMGYKSLVPSPPRRLFEPYLSHLHDIDGVDMASRKPAIRTSSHLYLLQHFDDPLHLQDDCLFYGSYGIQTISAHHALRCHPIHPRAARHCSEIRLLHCFPCEYRNLWSLRHGCHL